MRAVLNQLLNRRETHNPRRRYYGRRLHLQAHCKDVVFYDRLSDSNYPQERVDRYTPGYPTRNPMLDWLLNMATKRSSRW